MSHSQTSVTTSGSGIARRAYRALATGAVGAAFVVATPALAHAGYNDWLYVSHTPEHCVHYSFGDVCTPGYTTQRRDIPYCEHPPYVPGGTQEWYDYCYRNVPD